MPAKKTTVTEVRADGKERTYRRKPGRSQFGTVRKLPSGRYQASFAGPDGRRHNAPMTYTVKGDAAAWLTEQERALNRGEWTPGVVTEQHDNQAARAVILSDYAERWIESRKVRGEPLRDRTKAEYRRLLAGPLAELAKQPLVALRPQAIREWHAAESAEKVTQAARAYGLLRAILATAVEDELIDAQPCKVRGAASKSTGRKVEPPTVEELAIIEAAMPEQYRAAVPIAALSALRWGELTELRRRDVTFDNETAILNVTRAVTRTPGVGFKVGPPKTDAGLRRVALPRGVSATLRDHLAEHVPDDDDALLFPNEAGDWLNQSTWARWWYKARADAGRDDLPWHGLRHYGLTEYARQGATAKEIMSRAGHTTVGVAMRYQHATEERDRELAARMETPQ